MLHFSPIELRNKVQSIFVVLVLLRTCTVLRKYGSSTDALQLKSFHVIELLISCSSMLNEIGFELTTKNPIKIGLKRKKIFPLPLPDAMINSFR